MRGLRQGDPLSPYLFVLCMEVLSLLLEDHIQNASQFYFHHMCERLRVVQLGFADDILLFCGADGDSVRVLINALREFEALSGLTINPLKSDMFLSRSAGNYADLLCNITGFRLSNLPVRYLGVPLITTKLTKNDCMPLVEKIVGRISSWTNGSLSYAGRMQLIQSVLYSIQMFWASLFHIPSSILKLIEQKLRCFLWSGTGMVSTKAKVAWDKICLPKKEGGLGFRSLQRWNKVLLAKWVWILFIDKNSLWVKWIHTHRLRGRCFWRIKTPNDASWSWRKLLALRDELHPFFVHRIGDGEGTYLWWDNWHPFGPLVSRYTDRIIYESGLSKDVKVSTIIRGETWCWGQANSQSLCEVRECMPTYCPNTSREDVVEWVGHNSGRFSTKSAWEQLRPKSNQVLWHSLIWFSQCIPRHSFIVWLAILEKLKTQDHLLHLVRGPLNCLLCNGPMETHDHLFFSCPYSSQIWQHVLQFCDLSCRVSRWEEIVMWASLVSKRRSSESILFRLAFTSLIYLLWRERNNRVFERGYKSIEQLKLMLLVIVRDACYAKGITEFQDSSLARRWGLI